MPRINRPFLHPYNWVSKVTGTFLREQRRGMSLSGGELAEKMQISQQQVSRYERGITHINLTMLLRYFSALNMNEREIQHFFELIASWNEEMKKKS
ncbi:TPA: helix-turn-helix domain-containing protein [Providencia alcalifaciens]